MLVDRLDLVQNKLNEQERKVLSLTKLVELTASIESTSSAHKFKQDISKIDSMIDKKVAECTKHLLDVLDSKLEGHSNKL